jgi:small subunit ribosomal protein S4
VELSVAKPSTVQEWLSWNEAILEGTLVSVPTREQITENIKEQLIVELYSK